MASSDLAAAVAALLKDNPERIVALASSLRAPNRSVESRVQGTSMGPSLPAGTRVRIDMSPRADYPIGAVIAFVEGNRLIVHRIVHAGRDYVLTRGDARIAPDIPVKREHVIGLVTADSGDGEWRKVASPRRRRGLAGACAMLAVLAARVVLRASPVVTAALMRCLYVVEGRVREMLAREPSR
jgi:hypothetical protein